MRDEALPRGGRRSPAPPPPLSGELVRARLLQQLGRRFSTPVTVVVAGAGFGKSTLLAQAIRSNQAEPCGIDAWVSCQPGDGDAAHLAMAVVRALGGRSDRGDPLGQVLEVVGQLAPLDVCVVIDDIHELPPGSDGEALLADLVGHLPPHAHLVLSGRRWPTVPLARRRAAGQVIDVGVESLAFTDNEVAALADQLGHRPDRLASLSGLAGWPSLVRLALSAPMGSAPQFLWEEIVDALDGDERASMLALATLGWGTADDVAAVSGLAADEERLDRLVDAVPLVRRDADGWLSVHQLWEDAVERIFPQRERAPMQRRALVLLQARGETVRSGWKALRWGAVDALCGAARLLVRDSFGALPIDTAARWVASAPEPARATPELRLLELALRHARRFDDRLDEEIDAVADEFLTVGDSEGSAVALALGALVAHTCGDHQRLLAIDGRARSLLAAADQPILRFLSVGMTAAVASLQGDADAAADTLAGLDFDEIPAAITELELRLFVNMLGFAGRADEAVVAAQPLLDSPSAYVRTIPAHARWLAGDPSGFAGGRLGADPGVGTNQRYHLYHATYGTAVAGSFGDAGTIEELRPVIEKFAAGHVDSRDRAMVAFATAVRLVVDHDEAAARRTIAEHVDAHDPADRLAELHLRRLLATAYVLDERIRERWHGADLGPSHRRQRAIADDLLSARAGALHAGHQLAAAPAVLTVLPLPWSVELAARAVVAGCASGKRLAVGLADLAPAAVRVELDRAAAHGDEEVRRGAAELLRVVPDPARPAIHVGVLGELEVVVGDDPVDNAELRRRRVRSLLELLAVAAPMRRDRLADLMWPHLDGVAAGRNLRVTLSRLRTVLEPGRAGGACPALRLDGDSVSLAPSPHVEVDLRQFRADVAAAEAASRGGDSAGTIAALERACGRWRGEPFADLELIDDLAGAVEEVRSALADAALWLGELLLVAGRFGRAARWAERVTVSAPYSERAHRLAIAAHLQRGERHDIDRAVASARAMLDDLGVQPEAATQMLLRQAESRIGTMFTTT